MTARGVFCAVAVALVAAAPAARGRQSADDDLIKKARAIHDKAITLDTHVDINPSGFTAERNYTQRLDTQVNLPKMVDGGLDAVFLIVYVGQPSLQSTPDAFEPAGYERAYKAAIEKFDAVHRLTETIAPGQVFVPFHYAESNANQLTQAAFDPISREPNYKQSAVRVERTAR